MAASSFPYPVFTYVLTVSGRGLYTVNGVPFQLQVFVTPPGTTNLSLTTMRRAVLLAALYSASRSGTVVSAFRIAPPSAVLSRAAPRRGLSNPTATTSTSYSRPPAVEVLGGVLRRTCSPLSAGGVTVGARGRTNIERRHTGGLCAGNSEGEESKGDSSGSENEAGGGGSSGGSGKKVANLVAKFGPAGLVAYGVLNGVFYSAGIAYVMLGPMGVVTATTVGIKPAIAAAVKQLAKVIGFVWLGSQATKPLRLALSALLAPIAGRLIDSTQRRLRLDTKKDAVSLLVAAIFGSTLLFCAAVVLLAATRAAVTASIATGTPSTAAPSSSSALLLLLGLRGTGGARRSASGLGFGFGGGGGGGSGGDASSSLPLLPLPCLSAPGDRAAAFGHRNGGNRRGDGGCGRPRRAAGQASHRAASSSSGDQQQGLDGRSYTARSGSRQAVATGAAGDAEGAAPEKSLALPPAGSAPTTAAAAAAGTIPRPPTRPLKRRRDRTVLTPQQAADRNPPPQDNIHGWNEHPNHLLGLWEVGPAEPLPSPQDWWAPEAVAAAAPSVAAAAALAAAAAAAAATTAGDSGRQHSDSNASPDDADPAPAAAAGIEAGGFSYRQTAERDMINHGSDVLHHVKYVVFRRGGALKAGPSDIGVGPRSWRFNPGSRRILFEVDVPARGVTLRYTGKLKRLPGRFTRAKGVIRVRPMDLPADMLAGDGGGGDKQQRQRQQPPVPPSNRQWPKLAAFTMELDLPEKFRHKENRRGGPTE